MRSRRYLRYLRRGGFGWPCHIIFREGQWCLATALTGTQPVPEEFLHSTRPAHRNRKAVEKAKVRYRRNLDRRIRKSLARPDPEDF